MSADLSHRDTRVVTNDADHSAGHGVSLVFILVIAVAFTALAFVAHTTPYFDFDLTITRAVQSIQAPWFDALLRAVGFPGYPPQIYVELVVLVVLFWFLGLRWEAITLLLSNLGIGALGMGVKLLVARMRPSPDLVYVANPNLQGGGLSFPAGHVQGAVVTLGFFIYLLWKLPRRAWWQTALLVFLGLLIVLMGLSRIYVGEHWFSDVVGGYLLGAIGLWLTIRFYEWGEVKYGKRKKETS